MRTVRIKSIIGLMVVVLCATFFLSACLSENDTYIIPEGREVETLRVYFRSIGRAVTLSGEDFTLVEEGLRRVPKLSPAPSDEDVGNSAEGSYDYTISVSLKKQGLKSARTFKVYIGVYIAATIVPSADETKSIGKAEVHTIGYTGSCDSELINTLEAIKTSTIAGLSDKTDV